MSQSERQIRVVSVRCPAPCRPRAPTVVRLGTDTVVRQTSPLGRHDHRDRHRAVTPSAGQLLSVWVVQELSDWLSVWVVQELSDRLSVWVVRELLFCPASVPLRFPFHSC